MDAGTREIPNKALRAGLTVRRIAFTGIILAIGFGQGWGTALTVPDWTLAEDVWWAMAFALGVQALTTIVLDRSGSHA